MARLRQELQEQELLQVLLAGPVGLVVRLQLVHR
jgi:hypothetical protein